MKAIEKPAEGRAVLGRSRAEAMVAAAASLDPLDRRLVEQVYRYGQPLQGVARLVGWPTEKVRRRLKRLEERVLGRDFKVVTQCLPLFPEPYRAAAELRVLRGWTLVRAAKELGLTFHEVRELDQAVRALIRVGGALVVADAAKRFGSASASGVRPHGA